MKNFLETLKRLLQDNGPVLLISTALILYYYGPLLVHPQSFLFNGSGDGLKNYYTYVWYIQNNAFSTEFSGMNYPYGEHLLYTDCHPLPVFLLKLLSFIHPIFAENCIGILNVALLISPILAAVVLYRIFRNLQIDQPLATASAVGLMMLSPQTFRLTGHLALSYSFCIPISIYLIQKYYQNLTSRKHLIFLFFNTLFWFSIHAYLGMMTLILTSGIGVFMLFHKEKRQRGINLFATGFSAFMIFYLFLILTDNHEGRTNNPWGIYELHSSFSSIFLPKRGPIAELIKHVFPSIDPPIEGISYIGIISLLASIVVLFQNIYYRIKFRNEKKQAIINHPLLRYLTWTGVFCLMFSMLFPFWWKLEKFLEYFQFIKQFRAIGRFAWIFYFIIGIVATYKIQEYLAGKSHPKLVSKFLIPLIFLSVPVWESKEYHLEIQQNANKYKNIFDTQHLSKDLKTSLKSVNSKDYQALIPLPYYYIGSDNYGKTANDSIYKLSKTLSFHLKMPIMASFLSRTSVSDSKKMMQITGLGLYPKPIINDISDQRPFLLVVNKSSVTNEELKIIERAKPLFKSESFSLFELSKKDLFHDDRSESWNKAIQPSESLANSDEVIYENFENSNFSGLLSNTSKQINGGIYTILHSINNGHFQKDQEYILSMWMNNAGINSGQDQLSGYCFIEKNYNNKKTWITGTISPNQSTNIFGDWSFVEIRFWGQEPSASYDIMFKRDGYINHPIEIDHLLIRPANKDYRNIFVWKNDSIMHYNGHLIVKPN
jgi:hypothetical protein